MKKIDETTNQGFGSSLMNGFLMEEVFGLETFSEKIFFFLNRKMMMTVRIRLVMMKLLDKKFVWKRFRKFFCFGLKFLKEFKNDDRRE